MHWLQVSLPSLQPRPLRAPQGQMPVSVACCPLVIGAQPCLVGTQDEGAKLVSWAQGTCGVYSPGPAQSDLAPNALSRRPRQSPTQGPKTLQGLTRCCLQNKGPHGQATHGNLCLCTRHLLSMASSFRPAPTPPFPQGARLEPCTLCSLCLPHPPHTQPWLPSTHTCFSCTHTCTRISYTHAPVHTLLSSCTQHLYTHSSCTQTHTHSTYTHRHTHRQSHLLHTCTHPLEPCSHSGSHSTLHAPPCSTYSPPPTPWVLLQKNYSFFDFLSLLSS